MELTQFNFHGHGVRVVADEHGEPWWIAKDVCHVLDLGNVSQAVVTLDPDERGVTTADTPGGVQQVGTISESGLYSLILRSRKPEARDFKRWITREVIPSIRRTGSYGQPDVAQITRADLARMVLEAEEQLAIAGPKADAFDAFLSTKGDYSVNEAAKVLAREHDILTGEKRLRDWMQAHGWIYRTPKGEPIGYQSRIDSGHISHRARFHHHPETGERILDTPQVRVTAKGVDALARALVKRGHQNEMALEVI